MKFDRGFISPYFITDAKTQEVEMESPLILLVEKKVSSLQQIVPLLESVVKSQRALLIIAEDVESEALATLVVNKLRAGIKICAVKAPGFGDNRKATMQDIAVLTGAKVVSEDLGMTLETTTMEDLGSCKKITVTKDSTLILDGSGSKGGIEERAELIRNSIEQTKSEYEKEKLQERLAKIGGGVAVIKVGGASEVEVNEVRESTPPKSAVGEEGVRATLTSRRPLTSDLLPPLSPSTLAGEGPRRRRSERHSRRRLRRYCPWRR